MAKKKQGATERFAINKQLSRQAKAAAEKERQAQERRAEAARKNARMGNFFLYAVLSVVTVFCLYLLIRTLFFPASSLAELRSNLLFLSVAGLPFLLAAAAVILHKANRKNRSGYSARGQRAANLLYGAALLAALCLFGFQLLSGRTDGRSSAAYTATLEALERSGLPVTEPEQAPAFRALLEYSMQSELVCGDTLLVLSEHRDRSGWAAKRFDAQANLDYASFAFAEDNGLRIWGPMEQDGVARAALMEHQGGDIRIWELYGPAEELKLLLPLLTSHSS